MLKFFYSLSRKFHIVSYKLTKNPPSIKQTFIVSKTIEIVFLMCKYIVKMRLTLPI